MKMPQDNYYKLLELDYDITNTDEIKKAIFNGIKKWSSLINHPRDGSIARQNLALLQKAKEDLSTPAIWEEHANKARELDEKENKANKQALEKDLRASIAIIAEKGWIEEAEVNAMSQTFKLSRQDIEAEINFPIESRTVARKQRKKTEVDVSTIKKIVKECEKLQIEAAHSSKVPSLYDFLNVAPTTSTDQLDKIADDAYNAIRKEVNRDIYNSKMYLQGQCKTFFKSEADRKKYDTALAQLRLQKLDDYLKVATASKTLYKPVVQKLKEQVITFGNVTEAEANEFIEDYCQKHHIDIDSETNIPQLKDIKKCTVCDLVNDGKNHYCTNCSTNLEAVCPKCNTSTDSYHLACGKCGFFLGNMVNIPYRIGMANEAIHENQFDKAKSLLDEMLNWWPNHPEAMKKLTAIQHREQETNRILATIKDHWQHQNYYSLRKLFIDHHDIVQSSASLQSMEKEGLERIHLAESYVKRAESIQDDTKKADYYVKALEVAPDCTKATKSLAQWPPAPPTELLASAQPNSTALQWQPSVSNGPVVYKVLRKQGEPSHHFKDGEVLEETSKCTVSDVTAIGGYPYYYTVYAMRGDIISKACDSVGPIIRTSEVEQFDITQTDDHIALTWDKPAGAMTIEVWRKENEVPTRRQDGELIGSINDNGMMDDTVVFGNSYGYLVIAVYEVEGIKTYSKGLSRLHKFTSIPKNVQYIRTERQTDGILLQSDPLEQADEQLAIYYAYTPFSNLSKGTIALEDLPQSAEKVMIDQTKNEAFLQVNMQQTVYLLPVTYNNEIAMVGDMIISKDHPEVANIRHNTVGQHIVFKWQWPPNIDEVFIACRNDRYATHPKDATDPVITLHKEAYQKDNGFQLLLEKRDYYVTIFTNYESNGIKMHSNGITDLFVNTEQVNITYEIKSPMFSKKMRLHLYSNQPITLPELVLVKGNDVPRMRDQGEDILTITPQQIVDAYRVDVPAEFVQANTFARLFFENEQDTQKFRLQARQGNDSLKLG